MSIRDDLHIAITCMVIAFTRQGSLVRSQYRPPWNQALKPSSRWLFCFLADKEYVETC